MPLGAGNGRAIADGETLRSEGYSGAHATAEDSVSSSRRCLAVGGVSVPWNGSSSPRPRTGGLRRFRRRARASPFRARRYRAAAKLPLTGWAQRRSPPWRGVVSELSPRSPAPWSRPPSSATLTMINRSDVGALHGVSRRALSSRHPIALFPLSPHGPAGFSTTAGNADRAVLYDFMRFPAVI